MAANSPNFRAHGDNNRQTSHRHTTEALQDMEELFQGIGTPNPAITDDIIHNSRAQVHDVFAARGQDESEQVLGHAQNQQRRLNNEPGLGRRVTEWFTRSRPAEWLTGNARPDSNFIRRERFHDAPAGNAAADVRARREIGKSAFMDAEAIWNLLDDDTRRTLRERLGTHVVEEAQDNPELLFALRFLTQEVGAHAPAGFNRSEFIRQAIDGEDHGDHARPATELEESKNRLLPMAAGVQSAAQAIRARCRTGLAAEITRLDGEVNRLGGIPANPATGAAAVPGEIDAANRAVTTAQTALSRLAATAPGIPAAQQAVNDAVAARTDIQTRLQQARTNRNEINALGFSLRDQLEDFRTELDDFYRHPPDAAHPAGHVVIPPAIAAQNAAITALLAQIADPATRALNMGAIDAGVLNITSNGFQRNWALIRTNVDTAITAAKNAHHAPHAPETITSSQLLYRMYHRYLTVDEAHGGMQPAGTHMNDMQRNGMRERALLFTRFAMSEAKDATTIEANRVRAEILARGGMNRRDRAQFLPDFSKILETFRFLAVEDQRPFAKLKLHQDITRAELRTEIQKGNLSVDQIPHLVIHLESVLKGHENKIIKEADVPLVLAMIRNLRVIRDEQRFKTIMAKPGSFDDKMKELLANDNAEETARGGVNDALLFDAITNKKFVKEQEAHIIEDVKNRVRNGELTIKDAMKELKDNGIDAGRGTWAKLLAIRTGQNVKNTWKNAKGRGPFAWAGRKVKSGWASAKKITGAPKWFMGTFLGKALNYSLNPKTMGKNYSPLPPFLKGGHGHGHGGGDHGGGDAHGGAAKH